MTNVAIIGCGFVVDYYMLTLTKSKILKVVGVFDLIGERARKTAEHYSIPRVYDSLEELLADDSVEIVLNLTNPRQHYETSKACLQAGKHVYSEKPMAMTVDQAKELVDLAKVNALRISTAPCSLLGEAAQTVWKALREDQIGQVRVVYAELDEDLVRKVQAGYLRTNLGLAWPAKDEFEIGVTLEHAGYYLTWLPAFFGPAKAVTAFGASLIPDKIPGVALDPPDAPDFTVACVEFQSGTVARLTCGIVAPRDHSLTLIGDNGILHVEEAWNYGSPVRVRPREWNYGRVTNPATKFIARVRKKIVKHFPFLEVLGRLPNPHGRRRPLVRPLPDFAWQTVLRMDFSRGVQELADAINEGRESRLSTEYSLHVTELLLPFTMLVAPVNPTA